MTSIAIASAAAASQSTVFVTSGTTGSAVGYSAGAQTFAGGAAGSITGLVFGVAPFLIIADGANTTFALRLPGTLASTFFRTLKIFNSAGTSLLLTRNASQLTFSTGNVGPAGAASSTWADTSDSLVTLVNATVYQVQFFR